MTSSYKNNIPQSDDRLIVSQVDLLNNATQLDTSMGVDHYNFSDNTTANGKHKTVTHLDQTSHPSTAATEVKSYAVDTGTLGLMSWSRSDTDGDVTGINGIHSSGEVVINTSATPTNIIDFASLNACAGTLTAWSDSTANAYAFARFFWAPTSPNSFLRLVIVGQSNNTISWLTDSATLLRLEATPAAINAYWTVTIDRYAL